MKRLRVYSWKPAPRPGGHPCGNAYHASGGRATSPEVIPVLRSRHPAAEPARQARRGRAGQRTSDRGGLRDRSTARSIDRVQGDRRLGGGSPGSVRPPPPLPLRPLADCGTLPARVRSESLAGCSGRRWPRSTSSGARPTSRSGSWSRPCRRCSARACASRWRGRSCGRSCACAAAPSACASPAAQAIGTALAGTLLCFGGNGFVTVAEQEVPSGLAALIIGAGAAVGGAHAAGRGRPAPARDAGGRGRGLRRPGGARAPRRPARRRAAVGRAPHRLGLDLLGRRLLLLEADGPARPTASCPPPSRCCSAARR